MAVWVIDDMTIDGVVRPPLVTDQARWRRIVIDRPTQIAFWRMDDTPVFYPAKADDAVKVITLKKNGVPTWTAQLTVDRPSPDHATFRGVDRRARASHGDAPRAARVVSARESRLPLDSGVSVQSMIDAIIVGSGPNGLAAAITLASAGRSVRVYEAQPSIGGGLRSAALTEPGSVHDVCAAVMALAEVSPFFRGLPLAKYGVELARPAAPFAHPLDDGTAVVAEHTVEATADGLDPADTRAYRSAIGPLVHNAGPLFEALLAPLGRRHPFLMAQFGLRAIRSAEGLARATFSGSRARALFAGAGRAQPRAAHLHRNGRLWARTLDVCASRRLAGGARRVATARRRPGRDSPRPRREI